MNDLVDAVNDVLQQAVERAGPNVHFVDYDEYVDMIDGRFCEPGVDESKGNGADRPDLFFYQMKTEEGSPEEGPDNIENAKRDEEATLSETYGAWIEETLEKSHGQVELNPNNANEELIQVVEAYKQRMKVQSGSKAKRDEDDVTPINGTVAEMIGAWVDETLEESGGTAVLNTDNANDELKAFIDSKQAEMAQERANSKKMRREEDEDAKKSSAIPDSVARVFHPTRGGHEMIANLILYKMEAVRAGMYRFVVSCKYQ